MGTLKWPGRYNVLLHLLTHPLSRSAWQDSLTASYRKTETTGTLSAVTIVTCLPHPAIDSPLSPATDLLSTLDHEDPVARALFKMVDLNDKVPGRVCACYLWPIINLLTNQITEHYQCARLTGLDSYDGLLMFGSTHFYIVEGITITKSGSVVDLESASEGLAITIWRAGLINFTDSSGATTQWFPPTSRPTLSRWRAVLLSGESAPLVTMVIQQAPPPKAVPSGCTILYERFTRDDIYWDTVHLKCSPMMGRLSSWSHTSLRETRSTKSKPSRH